MNTLCFFLFVARQQKNDLKEFKIPFKKRILAKLWMNYHFTTKSTHYA